MASDFDSAFPVEHDDIFPSQRVVTTDSVRWQSSQLSSCAALNSLILEIPARRKITHDTSWYNQEASTSTSSQPNGTSNHRPLVRSNSRARFNRLSEPGTHPPPDLTLFNKKDPMQFLDLIKGVSERVDENAGLRSARGSDKSGMKRKTRASASGVGEVHAKARGVRLSYASEGQNKASRIKGKQRADGGGDTEYESHSPDGTHRSLPNLSSSMSTAASSSSLRSINTSISTDVDASMSMDTMMDLDESGHNISLPSMSKRHSGTSYPPPSNHINTQASPDPPTVPHKVTPEPKLHPLLTQQKTRPQKQPTPKLQFFPPPSSQRVPSMSQVSGPVRVPALGMRRTASTPAATTTHNALPTRQKGFKPPLLPGTQPQPQQPKTAAQAAVKASPQSHVVPARGPNAGGGKFTRPSAAPGLTKNKGCPPRAPSPEPDPDSSFGDMSFDMDVDALEETMRMYD
ncbi:hypothetical protein BDZ94DRAFT_1320270 [Collybia nuda]|uniref:Uncharacterized protein n=1 Tax=Collybia nuda TaxID=64659 RepID=A0A9P6CGN0_9AGAR|nr:hypothetical protein BDZ94DRAFT_1320270 [Collybia nuda]